MTTERTKQTKIAIGHECPQLLCFPFAGGTASFFDQMEQDLAGSVDVITFEYPGHGERHKESLCQDMNELADDVFKQFFKKIFREKYIGDTYALFGYSMGAIVLVEVLIKILTSIFPKPKHIFLAAHAPKTEKEILSYSSDELNKWIKARLIKLETVPEQLKNNDTFWHLHMSLYRTDYIILAKNNIEDLELRTGIPATIFYSETDTPLKER